MKRDAISVRSMIRWRRRKKSSPATTLNPSFGKRVTSGLQGRRTRSSLRKGA